MATLRFHLSANILSFIESMWDQTDIKAMQPRLSATSTRRHSHRHLYGHYVGGGFVMFQKKNCCGQKDRATLCQPRLFRTFTDAIKNLKTLETIEKVNNYNKGSEKFRKKTELFRTFQEAFEPCKVNGWLIEFMSTSHPIQNTSSRRCTDIYIFIYQMRSECT